jgi:HTH-type transcriptional regulator, transcriptional repressor of NAD biosynthesis genes
VRRYGHGLVIGKFYPPHAGHHHLIDAAAAACDRLTVVVAPASTESIPLDLRCSWLRERHAGVEVVGVYDDHPVDYHDPDVWEAHCAVFRAAAGVSTVDAVFSSEGYGEELARRFQAVHVCVDRERLAVPVSGRAVRADPVAHWAYLSPPVRAWFAKRVVVVGAESTGTTTLARALAEEYARRGGVWANTEWVPEYGRELTERKLATLRERYPSATVFDVRWERADFVAVAREQNAAEDRAARTGSPLLVCDTDALATSVWEERYLGSSSGEVRAAARPADLYLLTELAGVPFVDDGLRDGEHIRQWMTDRLREVLGWSGVPVVEVSGAPQARLATALAAVDGLFAAGWVLAQPAG